MITASGHVATDTDLPQLPRVELRAARRVITKADHLRGAIVHSFEVQDRGEKASQATGRS